MNPITKALSDISYRIPREILIEVFAPKSYLWRDSPINYEEQIRNIVIRSRVMVDCDLVGGTEVLISLFGVPSYTVASDRLVTVYNIPKDKTQGRTIISVLSLAYVNGASAAYMNTANSFDPCTVTDMAVAGAAMMNAMGSLPVPSSAKIQLIGENTVMIKDTVTASGTGLLRCLLANDENFSHLQIRSIPYFTRLCELATKAYIYNEYTIKMDKGRIEGGAEIGRFREIVDGYADAEEMYQEYLLNTWQKVSFMNDRESFERLLKMQIGAYR